MKSAILEKGEQWFTDVFKIFGAINNIALNYNWLITDIECHPNNEAIRNLFSQEYVWISGEELTKILNENSIQFIWGVFSGFSEGIKLQDVLKYPLPYADENAGFWVDKPQIQHPLATVEIVA